ncbi:MAG TPA: phage protein Gp36 family protein [Trebonia sp.]|jgi:phage gp36-like protein|nr:phage protein Gp36 family protein [Trebonia sp.]
MPAMYCLPADIRSNVAGTDAGTGTCAMLEDYQLSAAIAQASSKVSAYVGTSFVIDAADPVANVPDLVKTCTIQIATFYATLTYRKGKDLSQYDPVVLGYNDAISTLKDVVAGNIEIAPTAPADPTDKPGHVVQTIPSIFGYSDSGTVPNGRGGIEPAGAPGTRFAEGWW